MFACPVQDQCIAIGIAQLRLAPEPRLVLRQAVKNEPQRNEFRDACIQVGTFKIHDHTITSRQGSHLMDGKCGSAIWAFQAGVARDRIDNQAQAEQLVEGDRP